MKILKNLDIRLVSLALAAILWLHAVTEREYTVTFNCLVSVRNVPQDFVLASVLMPVPCSITAKGKDLLALKLRTPRLSIDAGNRRIRNLSAKLNGSHLELPFGLEPTNAVFQPPDLVIKLDRRGTKVVAVAADMSGQPAEGFIVSDSCSAEPCSVLLIGPERAVLQADTVFTEKIRVDELNAPLRRRVKLAVTEPQLFRTDPESVWVDLRFEKSGERLFKNIPLTLANRGPGYLVGFSPGAVDIVVAGPQNLLKTAGSGDIRVFLDLKGLAPGTHRIQAVIELPEKLELIAADPRTFEVTIR